MSNCIKKKRGFFYSQKKDNNPELHRGHLEIQASRGCPPRKYFAEGPEDLGTRLWIMEIGEVRLAGISILSGRLPRSFSSLEM